MPAKAFSIEDGNLQTKSIIAARQRQYTDIDLTFTNKTTGDIYKKTNTAAVKQAIKNLLLTNRTEKPFQPYYGGDLNRFLFSLSEDFDEDDVRDNIAAAIQNYEPRVQVRDIQVLILPDSYDVKVTVIFQVISTSEVVSLDVSIARLR